jgi:hypothetical protein
MLTRMEPWQAALIGRIVDEIDTFNAGRISLPKLVENSRGLFEAADISDNETRMAFESVWAAVDAQDELRTEAWSRPEWVSDQALNDAVSDLRVWASAVSVSGRSPDP